MKNHLSFLFLFFLTNTIFAQNLLPDGGFEDWNGTVPTGTEQSLEPLTHWYNVMGSPDHRHENNTGVNLTQLNDCPQGNGDSACGQPVAGQAVLGCYKANGADGNREWAGTALTAPMLAGNCYEVSFYVQNKRDNPDFPMLIDQWGLYFSPTELPTFNVNLANYSVMQENFYAAPEVIDGSDWRQFTFNYVAPEDISHLFVGFMGDGSTASPTTWTDDFMVGFYVWFDEISIVPIEPLLTVTEDTEICPGDSVLLTFDSNFPIIWDNGTQTGTTTELWVTPETETTYTVQTQDGTACSVTETVEITFRAGAQLTYPEDICLGASPFLLDPTAGAGTWSGPGIIDPQTGLFDPNVAGLGAVEIQFISDADCANDFTLTAEVQFIPGAFIDYPELVCLNETPFILNAELTDGRWEGAGVIDEETGLFDPMLAGAGAAEIAFISDFDCDANVVLTVEVIETPTVDFTADTTGGCTPLSVNFTDLSSETGVDYAWDFGENAAAGTGANAAFLYQNAGDFDVSLTVTYSEKCSVTETKPAFIQTQERPLADFVYEPQFNIIENEVVEFINTSTGNFETTQWTFGDSTTSEQPSPTHIFTAPGVYPTTLTVSTAAGCTDSLIQNITVKGAVDIFIPNAFSPDFDGINDRLEVFAKGNILTFKMDIFDRWGGLIFTSTDRQNVWDGSVNGEPADEGVYLYVVEYSYIKLDAENPVRETAAGDVTLLR